MTSLEDDMADNAAEIERFLDGHLTNADHAILMGTPDRLLAAMRHGALGGGKRLRPYLVRVVAGMYGVPPAEAIRAGAALEMVHCYSLIHDDLPEMDNDRLRRGRPSVWAAYDPATAILAGDALLTAAFHLLADPETRRTRRCASGSSGASPSAPARPAWSAARCSTSRRRGGRSRSRTSPPSSR